MIGHKIRVDANDVKCSTFYVKVIYMYNKAVQQICLYSILGIQTSISFPDFYNNSATVDGTQAAI